MFFTSMAITVWGLYLLRDLSEIGISKTESTDQVITTSLLEFIQFYYMV